MSGIGPQPRVRALRRALAAGRIEPLDIVEDVLHRLENQAQPQAWIHTAPPSELRARAAELARVAPESRPALYGIPFAVKDNLDVAGMPTTVGCPEFTYLPTRTATSVQRLLDAGAILVGKANLDQFATGLTGARSPFGTCTSVLDPTLPSGGSSSGSAVVVADDVVPFSLGTDTAGSGRVPAVFNGIVGVKPTRGLVSTAGVFPACRSLDCVSIFAHDVADAWEVLEALAGVDAADPWSRERPAAHLAERKPLRVGIIGGDAAHWTGDAAQAHAYLAACRRVASVAPMVEQIELTAFLDAGDLLYDGPWIAERQAVLGDFLAAHPHAVHPVTAAALAPGTRVTGAQAFAGMHRLRELASRASATWQRVDVLVLPTVDVTFTVDEVSADLWGTNRALGRFTHFANLLDLAVVAVPTGRAPDGRPSGISLVGPAFSDALLSRLAHQLTSAEPADGVGRWSVDVEVKPRRARLAVVGHHLSGGPLNHELRDRGARLETTTRTAPQYRLYRVTRPNGSEPALIPGLVRTSSGGQRIEVEIWDLPTDGLGSLLGSIRAPLGLGQVELEDGSWTTGFLCEGYAVADAPDISDHGGWRAYLATAAQAV